MPAPHPQMSWDVVAIFPRPSTTVPRTFARNPAVVAVEQKVVASMEHPPHRLAAKWDRALEPSTGFYDDLEWARRLVHVAFGSTGVEALEAARLNW